MPESTMDQTIPVALSESDLAARAETMAAKVHTIARLRKKKSEDARSTQALIDGELDELTRLADSIEQGIEDRKQGELFVDEQTATEALAKVGEAACTCESEEVAAVDCPVHGTLAPQSANGQAEEGEGEDADLAEDPGDEPADDVAPFPPAGDAA